MSDGATTTGGSASIAFTLIYLTFFLDNVLLTVLVPIMPEWVSPRPITAAVGSPDYDTGIAPDNFTGAGGVPALLDTHQQHQLQVGVTWTEWAQGGAGSAGGWAQAGVGAALGAKAAAQLATAPLAAACVSRRGPAPVLRAATALLAGAAGGLAACGAACGAGAALCVCGARAAHGAGAALGGVAGLALAARALPPPRRRPALSALLGAVALGVLVGYPFGGATASLRSRSAPFLIVAAALLTNLALQYIFLDRKEYNRGEVEDGGAPACRGVMGAARCGAGGAGAGCVLLTTSVMAALEPCLPAWLERHLRPPPARDQLGLVFLPDSFGYLLAASCGGLAQRLGGERVAVVGQLLVAAGALGVAHARSLRGLVVPQLALGLGLGAADAALVPALVERGGESAAALLQAAGAAAYALAPPATALLAAAAGFELALRLLAAANLLYAAYLYCALRAHPLSEQWDAPGPNVSPLDAGPGETSPLAPLRPGQYVPLQ